MSNAKKPQDFKSGKNEPYTFSYDGETYTFDKPLTMGLVRKFRHMDESEAIWEVLDAIAGEEALSAIDNMSLPEFTEFSKAMFGASMGESSGSTT